VPATDLTNAFEPDVAIRPSPIPSGAAPVLTGSAPPPDVTAQSVAVVDEASGALLYGRDPHQELAPASLTKIFTAIVALSRGQLPQEVAVQFDPSQLADSTLMGIHPGETYPLEDLLYGLMLPSGNDAALAIANEIGGSVPQFVALMNSQANVLGLKDSHFVNPHGLDAPGHYSSAYDLAMAARYGMTHFAEFRQLASAQGWTVHGTRTFTIHNLNRFLSSYPGANGVKIGYTDAAGHTIVASATRGGHRVYVALLNCADIVQDSVPLFNWVFANFTWSS
jgi:D-alanyl-D-alanine carboxypeptidase